jgi:hypothetical protein
MPDKFDKNENGLSTPITDGVAINFSSDQTFANVCRGIHLSTAGTLVLVLKSGTTLTMLLEVGWHPIRATGIVSAGSSSAVGHACW